MNGRYDERGLDAVARVREVRVRDSRLGLQQAIAEQLELQRRLDAVEEVLRELRSTTEVSVDAAGWAARQSVLLAQGAAVRQARRDSEAAEVVRESAARHWRADTTRLSAVESLLEVRRAEQRRELARVVAKDLDETGAQLWSRRRAEGER